MFDEIATQIKAQLYDRARSPLFGTFVVSWTAWNFRAVLVLFSGDSLDLKFFVLDEIYKTQEIYLTKGLIYPALSATFFIIVYPYFARLAYWHWHSQHVKLKSTQQKIEDKTPMTQEEANAMRKASLDQELSFQYQIRSLSETNRELTNREESLINKISEQGGSINTLQEQLKNKSAELEQQKTSLSGLSEQIKMTHHKTQNAIKNDANQQKKILNFLIKINVSKTKLGTTRVKNLVSKLSKASSTMDVTIEMMEIILLLAFKDGVMSLGDIRNLLRADLSKIEIDNILSQLSKRAFIREIGSDIHLMEKGQEFAVTSGVTSLAKEILN